MQEKTSEGKAFGSFLSSWLGRQMQCQERKIVTMRKKVMMAQED